MTQIDPFSAVGHTPEEMRGIAKVVCIIQGDQ